MMIRSLTALFVLLHLAVMPGIARSAEPAQPARLLVVTVTTTFRHWSIMTAEPVLEEIGRSTGLYHIDFLRMPPGRPRAPQPPKRTPAMSDEDWSREQSSFQAADEKFRADNAAWMETVRGVFAMAFASEGLAQFDGVVFANTTGELPVPDLPAFLDWINSGKAFIGMHAATDTLNASDAYVDMIGGSFAGHPWTAGGEHGFVVHDPSHPVTAMLPERFRWQDEIYQYDLRLVPENLRVLVSLEMVASTPKEPWHVPVAWVRRYGEGRVFNTNFGHNDASWKDPRIQKHMQQGIAWALGRIDGTAEPNPDVQAAEYVRSGIAAAAAATNGNADRLLAKAAAKMAKDPGWAAAMRASLVDIRDSKAANRTEILKQLVVEIEKP